MRAFVSTRLGYAITIALALATSACGGGGGSSPSVPAPPGGPPPTNAPSSSPSTGPTASSSPSPSPTHTPNATPSPVHTQSPSPAPTIGGQSITILPDTTGRFGLMQINDAYGRVGTGMTTAQIQAEAPHYDSVWGTFFPNVWNQMHPGMLLSRYVLPNEDVKLISGHDLTWWQQNHPTWILYACDNNGNPTHDLAASGTGFGDVPLDIHNPDVIDYQIRQLVGPDMIAHGYNAIAADNITFSNYLVDQTQPASSGYYGCGIWNGNTFVYRYGGPGISDHNVADPAFINDLLNWIATTRNILNTDPTLAPHHFKLIVNHPFGGSTPNSNELQLLSNIDGMLYEPGFTHYGTLYTGGAFHNALNWMVYAQSRHLAIFMSDYFCVGSGCSHDPSTLAASQVDWALASYALGNNGGADVYISPAGGAIYSYRPEYARTYGAPCGAFVQNGNVYTRTFAGGFAVVNANSSGSAVVQLPAGHTYTDIENRPISNPLTVNPTDAYMLLLSSGGNGCS